MKETILIGIIVAVFSSLFTYVITSIVNRNSIYKVISEAFKQHEAVWHQQTVISTVKEAVSDHKKSCEGATKYAKIEKIVLAIYAKQGGKIEELDI